jgi:hypothetical protein
MKSINNYEKPSKKTQIKFLGIILLALLLNGCGTKWYHPTKNETQFYGDSSSCMSKAAQAFPQNIKKNKSYYPEEDTYETECWGNRCTTKKKSTGWESLRGSSDTNEANRNNHYTYCMRGLGYADKQTILGNEI